VALEVPVTVNGARTVEGSDKREPFSEKSATVLVFGHGAVIRVSTLLAPGQLVFLTNEKTKKEVVCQVVKSKTDGNAVGYVELRFTEPAPGFWGMRFPSDTVVPQPAAQTRPTAPAPLPAAPKTVPPAPVAVQPSPVKPATMPAPVTGSAPSVAEPKFAFPTPVPPAPFSAPQTLSHPEPAAPRAPVAAAPAVPMVEAKAAASTTPQPVLKASDPATEELKQQAARLQEQLSSLLFTEAPRPAAPVVASPDAAQKILEMADPSPASEPAAIKPIKVTAPASPKPAGGSLEGEEIKIPSWLAPLARETETPSSSANAFQVEGTNSDVESVIPRAPEQTILSEAQESVRRPETAVFGGQLLGESQPAEAATDKSKTGLFIGIAASLVLVAGGVWYSRQPGNAISGLLSDATPAAKSASAPESAATSSAAEPVTTPPAATPAPARVNPPVQAAPVASAPMDRNAHNTNLSASAQRNPQPVVEEPKKPSLGDVHLATPAVTSHGNSSANDPALEINASSNASAPISTLGDSHRAGPTAPVPIGGDVKPAKLIKSVPPSYPEMARSQRVSGDVQVDALIDANGNVSTMKVLSGSPLLHQAALTALKQWKYQPAELDGKPTSMHLTVTIQFRTQ
jgi:TonB family protein